MAAIAAAGGAPTEGGEVDGKKKKSLMGEASGTAVVDPKATADGPALEEPSAIEYDGPWYLRLQRLLCLAAARSRNPATAPSDALLAALRGVGFDALLLQGAHLPGAVQVAQQYRQELVDIANGHALTSSIAIEGAAAAHARGSEQAESKQRAEQELLRLMLQAGVRPQSSPSHPFLRPSRVGSLVDRVQFVNADPRLVRFNSGPFEVDVSANAGPAIAATCLVELCDRWFGCGHMLKRTFILLKAWASLDGGRAASALGHGAAAATGSRKGRGVPNAQRAQAEAGGSAPERTLLGASSGGVSSYALFVLLLGALNGSTTVPRSRSRSASSDTSVEPTEVMDVPQHPLQALAMFFRYYDGMPWESCVVGFDGAKNFYSRERWHGNGIASAQPTRITALMLRPLREAALGCVGRPKFLSKLDFDMRECNVADPLRPWENISRGVNTAGLDSLRRAIRRARGALSLVLSRACLASRMELPAPDAAGDAAGASSKQRTLKEAGEKRAKEARDKVTRVMPEHELSATRAEVRGMSAPLWCAMVGMRRLLSRCYDLYGRGDGWREDAQKHIRAVHEGVTARSLPAQGYAARNTASMVSTAHMSMVTRAESAAERAAAAGERALAVVERARGSGLRDRVLVRMSAVAAAAVAHADAAQDASDAAQVLAPSAGPDQSLRLARLANKHGMLDPSTEQGDDGADQDASSARAGGSDGGAEGAAWERQCGAARFLCRSKGAPQAPDAAAAAHAQIAERLTDLCDQMLAMEDTKVRLAAEPQRRLQGTIESRIAFDATATAPPMPELQGFEHTSAGATLGTASIPPTQWMAQVARPGLVPPAPILDGDFEPPPPTACLDPLRGDLLAMMRSVQRAALLCGLRAEEDCPLPGFVMGRGEDGEDGRGDRSAAGSGSGAVGDPGAGGGSKARKGSGSGREDSVGALHGSGGGGRRRSRGGSRSSASGSGKRATVGTAAITAAALVEEARAALGAVAPTEVSSPLYGLSQVAWIALSLPSHARFGAVPTAQQQLAEDRSLMGPLAPRHVLVDVAAVRSIPVGEVGKGVSARV